MKLEGKTRRDVIKLVKKLIQFRHRYPAQPAFKNNAYYITLGFYLVSAKPYYGWKNAWRAAKKVHSKAFFISGHKLNQRFPAIQIPQQALNIENVI